MNSMGNASASLARIGVDVGGTFTDIVLTLPDGRVYVNKTTTTPHDPGEGVVTGIAAVLAEARYCSRQCRRGGARDHRRIKHDPAKSGCPHGAADDARLSRRAGDRAHPHARHVRSDVAKARAASAATLAAGGCGAHRSRRQCGTASG